MKIEIEISDNIVSEIADLFERIKTLLPGKLAKEEDQIDTRLGSLSWR